MLRLFIDRAAALLGEEGKKLRLSQQALTGHAGGEYSFLRPENDTNPPTAFD
jgi:hypothetical protein